MIATVLLVLLGVFLTVVGFLVWAVVSSSAEEATAYQVERERRRAERQLQQITQAVVADMLAAARDRQR